MKDGETDVETILHLGNPSDVAEVRADLVVHVVQTTNVGSKVKDVNARIEWWLDEGEDEYVSLSPSLFLLVIRLDILSFLIPL